jgi:hypothetical protein
VNLKMNPIIDYELGKALHKERDAEYAQYWRLRVGDDIPQSAPKKYRAMVGIGGITLGALMIIQLLIG